MGAVIVPAPGARGGGDGDHRATGRKGRILRAMHDSRRPLRGGILKKLLIALALLVVVGVVAVVLLIDSIARVGIEAAGRYALGTKTTVASASIGIVSGKTAVRGLAVDNPAGFSPTKFVSLGAIEVDAGLSSFTGEKIVIDRVALTGLVIEIEKDGSGALNVQKFADHLKKATGAGGEKPTLPEQAPAEESKEAVIRELRLEKMQVNLRNVVGGKDGVVEVKLPDLVIRDLSSKGGVDVLASELSGVVIGAAVKGVLAANIEGLGSDVLGGLQGAVEGIGGAITGPLRDAVDKGVTEAGAALKAVGEGITKGLGEAAGKALEGAGKAIEGAGKSIGEGVGNALDGVFGGGKKK
jgi:hypothetical protein